MCTSKGNPHKNKNTKKYKNLSREHNASGVTVPIYPPVVVRPIWGRRVAVKSCRRHFERFVRKENRYTKADQNLHLRGAPEGEKTKTDKQTRLHVKSFAESLQRAHASMHFALRCTLELHRRTLPYQGTTTTTIRTGTPPPPLNSRTTEWWQNQPYSPERSMLLEVQEQGQSANRHTEGELQLNPAKRGALNYGGGGPSLFNHMPKNTRKINDRETPKGGVDKPARARIHASENPPTCGGTKKEKKKLQGPSFFGRLSENQRPNIFPVPPDPSSLRHTEYRHHLPVRGAHERPPAGGRFKHNNQNLFRPSR